MAGWVGATVMVMANEMSEDRLRAASDRFYLALTDVLAGDPSSMLELWSHADDVSYMGPLTEMLVGWESIRESWKLAADAKLSGTVRAEVNHFVVGGPLGFVVGYERGSSIVNGQWVVVDIRATSIYRLEAGEVKMIGHHTDRI